MRPRPSGNQQALFASGFSYNLSTRATAAAVGTESQFSVGVGEGAVGGVVASVFASSSLPPASILLKGSRFRVQSMRSCVICHKQAHISSELVAVMGKNLWQKSVVEAEVES